MDYIGNDEYSDGKILFSRAYQKVNHDTEQELRADRFAAELLMPKDTFLKKYVAALKRYNYDIDVVVFYLAKLFGVKKSCILRRIDEVTE